MEEQYSVTQKVIRRFKDVIILNYLKNNPFVTGYQLVTYIHNEMGVLIGPATIYSTLYLLERQNLVEANNVPGKRRYRLTKEGESEIQKIRRSINSVLSFIFSEVTELTA